MELSGSTTANWVAKSANLLVDELGSPDRIGLLLPLHWQTVVLLLAGVACGSTVVLARTPDELSGCAAAFVQAAAVEGALDAGVADVLALSGHPLGLPVTGLSAPALDFASEVPSYADHFGGPRPGPAAVQAGGRAVAACDGLSSQDRVLTALDPTDPRGAAVLLGALRAGASLVLLRAGSADAEGSSAAVAAAERVTVTAGVDVIGLPSLC